MKVMLAAVEDIHTLKCGTRIGHKNFLFSYFYQRGANKEKQLELFNELNNYGAETI